MEHASFRHLKAGIDENTKNEVAESIDLEMDSTDDTKEKQGYQRDNMEVSRADTEVEKNVKEDISHAHKDTQGEINMEASISADDVMRAGGFGARDDINSFLPVASDLTDFEASLLDAREYEEPREEISRPGLGWTESRK